MNILIVEDDGVSSSLLTAILSPCGQCSVVVDGTAAVVSFRSALAAKQPYDLVCLDVMLPGMDGQYVLRRMRRLEEQHGIGGLDTAKIVMITALGDHRTVMDAFRSQCEGYIVKPIRKDKVLKQLCSLGIMPPVPATGKRPT